MLAKMNEKRSVVSSIVDVQGRYSKFSIASFLTQSQLRLCLTKHFMLILSLSLICNQSTTYNYQQQQQQRQQQQSKLVSFIDAKDYRLITGRL